MSKMTEEAHLERHKELHKSLDELFADFIAYGGGRTTSTIMELINWTHKQTIKPDHSADGI